MGGPLGSDYIGNWGAALGAVILLCASVRAGMYAYKGFTGVKQPHSSAKAVVVCIATFLLFLYFIAAIWAHR